MKDVNKNKLLDAATAVKITIPGDKGGMKIQDAYTGIQNLADEGEEPFAHCDFRQNNDYLIALGDYKDLQMLVTKLKDAYGDITVDFVESGAAGAYTDFDENESFEDFVKNKKKPVNEQKINEASSHGWYVEVSHEMSEDEAQSIYRWAEDKIECELDGTDGPDSYTFKLYSPSKQDVEKFIGMMLSNSFARVINIGKF